MSSTRRNFFHARPLMVFRCIRSARFGTPPRSCLPRRASRRPAAPGDGWLPVLRSPGAPPRRCPCRSSAASCALAARLLAQRGGSWATRFSSTGGQARAAPLLGAAHGGIDSDQQPAAPHLDRDRGPTGSTGAVVARLSTRLPAPGPSDRPAAAAPRSSGCPARALNADRPAPRQRPAARLPVPLPGSMDGFGSARHAGQARTSTGTKPPTGAAVARSTPRSSALVPIGAPLRARSAPNSPPRPVPPPASAPSRPPQSRHPAAQGPPAPPPRPPAQFPAPPRRGAYVQPRMHADRIVRFGRWDPWPGKNRGAKSWRVMGAVRWDP